MQNITITKSIDDKHLYVYSTKQNLVQSYMLLKRIPNSHYLYVLSHTFENYIKGMFGEEVEVTDKIEDLGHHILYMHKTKKRKTNARQKAKKTIHTSK